MNRGSRPFSIVFDRFIRQIRQNSFEIVYGSVLNNTSHIKRFEAPYQSIQNDDDKID